MLLMANTVPLSSMMSVAMAMMAAIISTAMMYHPSPPPLIAPALMRIISSCNRDEDNDCSLTPPSPHGDNHADGDSDGAFFPLPHPSPKQKC